MVWELTWYVTQGGKLGACVCVYVCEGGGGGGRLGGVFWTNPLASHGDPADKQALEYNAGLGIEAGEQAPSRVC